MTSRKQFVQEACSRSANDALGRRGAIDFDKVTAELRRIARKLDPGNRYAKQDWSDRECLCGRLAVLIARNPEQANEQLTDAQKQLAIAVMQMEIEQDDNEPTWHEMDDSNDEVEVNSNRRRMATAAMAALLASPTLAATAMSTDTLVMPVVAAAATYFLSAGLQWGGTSLRKVSTAISEHATLQKKSHYSGMRRALAQHTTTALGGETTYNLRNRLLRYMTMDAQTVNNYIQSTGSIDGAKDLDELLLGEVRQRVRKAKDDVDINSVVGDVLAEFTFGGSVLRPFSKENLHCAFIPCAGVAHVGHNNAKDKEEHLSLKKLFADTYFRPSKKIAAMSKLPNDISKFWSASLATALNPDTGKHIPDTILYTIYYFVFRHIYKYGLIESMHCPQQAHRLGKLRMAATLSHRSLQADSAFECVFADYDQRFASSQSWSDWIKFKVGLSGFGK